MKPQTPEEIYRRTGNNLEGRFYGTKAHSIAAMKEYARQAIKYALKNL